MFIMPFFTRTFHMLVKFGGRKITLLQRRILVLQKRAIRIITFSNFNVASKPLFLNLRILNFFDLVKTLNILFIYQLLNHELPETIVNTFKLSLSSTGNRRRRSGFLNLPRTSTQSFGTYSIRVQAISSWNCLQENLSFENISILTFSKLKNLIKLFFFSTYCDLNE